MKKFLVLIGIMVVLAVVIYGYHEYTRAPLSAKEREPDFIINAPALASEFETNEQAATNKYSGRVLQVKGVLTSFESYNNITTMVLNAGNMSVRCVLDGNNALKSMPSTGKEVIIKGIYTGFNNDELLGSDIMMNNGIIIQND